MSTNVLTKIATELCVCMCVCIQVYISWRGLKPEYMQTHGDSCHGGDLN